MNETFSYKYSTLKNIPPGLFKKIDNLLELCFSQKERTPEQKAEHDDKYCSKKDRIGISFSENKGEIVGVVILLKRNLRYRGKQLILGGIGGVCVNENYRRKGLASNLLKIAVEKLKDEKCDLVYLCTDTDKLANLYKPFGFKKLETQYTYLGKSGKRYYEWGGMIAPITSSSLFKQILDNKESFDIGIGNW